METDEKKFGKSYRRERDKKKIDKDGTSGKLKMCANKALI